MTDDGSSLVFRPRAHLRGRRNYVHSTDIYPAILEGCRRLGFGEPDGSLTMTMRHIVQRQPLLRYGGATSADAPVSFGLTVAGRRIDGVLLEEGDPVSDRVPYDEGPIRESAVIEDRSIRVVSPCMATPIEVVTALAVRLHDHILPPSPGEKWLLARISLERPLVEGDRTGLRIVLGRVLGRRTTRSTIEVGGGALGTLEFLLGPGQVTP